MQVKLNFQGVMGFGAPIFRLRGSYYWGTSKPHGDARKRKNSRVDRKYGVRKPFLERG